MQLRALPESKAKETLKESANRVHSMALVHEKLYESGTLSSIDAYEYLHELSDYLATAAGAKQRGITLNLSIDHVQISLQASIPLGLILNELISNAFKYAFPETSTGLLCETHLPYRGTIKWIKLKYSF